MFVYNGGTFCIKHYCICNSTSYLLILAIPVAVSPMYFSQKG